MNNETTWKNEALGKNGRVYFLLKYSLPILPVGIMGFAWYMLCPAGTFEKMPTAVVAFVFFAVVLFFHQTYDAYNFIFVASKTAKIVTFKDRSVLELKLFSNKIIRSDDFVFISEQGDFSKTKKYKGLFALNIPYGTVTLNDGGIFYISGKTEKYENICSELTVKSIT